MNTNTKIFLGFLLGTAVGTATALLMAPTTGLTARKNINRKAKKLVKRMESLIGKQKRKVSTSAAQIKNGKAAVSAR